MVSMTRQMKLLMIVGFLFWLIWESHIYATEKDIFVKLPGINNYILQTYRYNNYYISYNNNNLTLNQKISNDYKVISYGPASINDAKYSNLTNQIECRFLGESKDSQKVPNYNYAYDTKSNIYFDDMYWITDPSNSPRVLNDSRFKWVQNSNFTTANITPLIRKSFLSGMHLQHGNKNRPSGDYFRGDALNNRGQPINWMNYIHIIDPPTYETHGSCMLWHITTGGKLYYIDVRLTRFKDLGATVYIKHRTTSGTPLTTYDYATTLDDSQTKDFKAKIIPNHQYKGLGIVQGVGTAPLQTAADAYLLSYAYENGKQIYTLTFYYDKDFKQIAIPTPTGAIRVSSTGFNVDKAIPTGEFVKIDARIDKPFIMDYRANYVSGTQAYTVEVYKPYTLEWTTTGVDASGKPITIYHSVDKTATQSFQIQRSYSYYNLQELYAFGLEFVNVYNSKLDALSPVLMAAQALGLKIPAVNYVLVGNHISQPLPQNSETHFEPSKNAYQVILDHSVYNSSSSPSFNFSGTAEQAIGPMEVRNDGLSVGTSVLMSSDWYTGSAPAPIPVTAAAVGSSPGLGAGSGPGAGSGAGSLLSPITITLNNHLLQHNISNGTDETTGLLHYKILALHNVTDPDIDEWVNGTSVAVHTPVVCSSSLAPLENLDQRPPGLKQTLGAPLDAVMTLHFSTTGPHLNQLGYGNRDYAAYVKKKRVSFPFDVYFSENASELLGPAASGIFVPADQWVDVPLDSTTFYYKIPYWVTPQDYGVLTQVIAKNHRTPAQYELVANLDPENDIAGQRADVAIVGRLFDFAITHVGDIQWRNVYQKLSSVYFTSGQMGKNGLQSGRGARSGFQGGIWPYTLPIMPGKHPLKGFSEASVKAGYPIRFSVKTMGDFYGPEDMIYVEPSFYRIDPTTKTREPVDVYYRLDGRYVLVGSAADTWQHSTILQNGRQELSTQDVLKTLDVFNQLGPAQTGQTGNQYLKSTLASTYVCKPKSALLSSALRVFIGGFDNAGGGAGSGALLPPGVNPDLVTASAQMWFGEYILPDSAVFVKKGADLQAAYRQGLDPTFRSGFLAVNFQLSAHHNMDLSAPQLLYSGDTANMWAIEGFNSNQGGLPLASGDVALYPIGQMASDDLRVRGK